MFSKHRQMLLQRLAHRTSVVGLHRLLVVTHRRVEVARGGKRIEWINLFPLCHGARFFRVIDRAFNPYWGAIFREARENSRFGQQVEDYACVYTSRVSNFLEATPFVYLRSPRGSLPHDIS